MYVFLSSVFSGLPRNICRSFRLPLKEKGRVQQDFKHKPKDQINPNAIYSSTNCATMCQAVFVCRIIWLYLWSVCGGQGYQQMHLLCICLFFCCCLFLKTGFLELRTRYDLTGWRDLNSGSYSCLISTLPAELCPQPRKQSF